MGLQLRLLGRMEVHVDAMALPVIKRRKARALLAYISLSRHREVSRAALSTLLWGDRSEVHARASLRQALSLLRRHLHIRGAVYLEADGERIWLRSMQTDVDAFERLCGNDTPSALTEGMSLYRGEFLEDLMVEEESFEHWQLTERARLRRIATDALQRLAALQLRAGDTAAAVFSGRRLLSLDAACEPGHRLLMLALARSGQRSAALEQYQPPSCISRRG